MRIRFDLPVLVGAMLCAAASLAETSGAGGAVEAPAVEVAAQASAELVTDGPVPVAVMEEGEKLFKANCRQCHGSKGTAGVPLKQNEKLADAFYLAGVILTGPGYMTEFGPYLDDRQIAAIASFVRNSWGNEYGAVTPQDVADLR